ncbi:hypothetical protein PRIPAC_80080 [Pristionchus pacificus]|uniref:phosphogluconate dehydrogenase (NADP(+)-dependent, decarboxylating) n=1 Tax=Pristionchus pacificus TaxID=54126 RepID=A0A2A6BWW9_PRIPA|nr:hypothetical protein PRIPAC_80080 [Pristionchus pacificus]|eukprot:PDM70395.1 hypothetical protein PRIPAC_46641 [Pristionchus pacificus]
MPRGNPAAWPHIKEIFQAVSAKSDGQPCCEAEFARCLSALKDDRVRASKELPQSDVDPSTLIKDKKEFIKAIQQDVYSSKIASYAQGFLLLAEAPKQFGWYLNYGAIALLWRGGSRFLGAIKKAFDSNPNLANLLLDNFFKDDIAKAHNFRGYVSDYDDN